MSKKRAVRSSMRGFSLIELLIVVAIILIVAAIAIPKLLQARATANENAAASSLRSFGSSLTAYDTKWGAFPTNASMLGGNCNATTPPSATLSCNLDNSTANAIGVNPIQGYNFTYTQTGSGAGFTLIADPATGNNATKHFYVDEGMTIHVNAAATASATDPVL